MIIELPDGRELDAPDGLDAAQIKSIVQKHTGAGPALPPQPPRLGMGDVQAAPSAFPGIGNVPVGLQTGDPVTDRQIAENFARQGFRHNLTPEDAIQAGVRGAALAGGALLPGSTALAPVLESAVAGGLFSGGLSKARSAGELATDIGAGAALGGATQKLGGLLRSALQRVSSRAGSKVAAAQAKTLAQSTTEEQAKQASRVGTYGGLRQTENKSILNLLAREEAGLLNAENTAALAALKATGRVSAAINETAARDLEFLATRTPEVLAAKTAMQEGAAALPEAIAARQAQLMSPAEAKSQVLARVKRYGPVAAGTLAGTAIGGPVGTAIGALAGMGTRPMTQAIRRMAQNPSVQARVYAPIERGALGAVGAVQAATPGAQTLTVGELAPRLAAALRRALEKRKKEENDE